MSQSTAARGSQTAIIYQDHILRPSLRPYAGAETLYEYAGPHVAGWCLQLHDEDMAVLQA